MTDCDYSTYNVFDVLYHLQKGAHGSCPFYERPPTLHVYGAFLLNAWRKRNIQLDTAMKKLHKVKKSCLASDRKLAHIDNSIEKIETENQVVYSTMISLREETMVAQQALETLINSNTKLEKDRGDLYEKINERTKLLEQKKEKAKQVETKTKSLIAKRELCKADFNKVMENVERTLHTNEKIQRYIDKIKSGIVKDLDDLKYEAETKAQHLMQEMSLYTEMADSYAETKERVDHLIQAVNKLEEEKKLRSHLKTSGSSGHVPWLWNSLMDIFGHSKREFAVHRNSVDTGEFSEVPENANEYNDFAKDDYAHEKYEDARSRRPGISRLPCH